MLKKSGLIFKRPVATVCRQRAIYCRFIHYVYGQLMPRSMCAIVLHTHPVLPFLSVLIGFHVIHKTPQLVQLINIVSNLIFHCNQCDANTCTAFIIIHESTAAAPSRPSGLLNAKFTFKGMSPPIIFARIVRPMNVLQLCR